MQQLSNFATTQLNGAISNSDTSIVVDNGGVFPASGDFYVLIESEIILVTARSSNTLTVTRGQDGTTAASHADDSLIKLTLSRAAIEAYFGERIQSGGYASRPSTARKGWQYFANDVNLAWDYDGTNWNLIHPCFVPYANRVNLSSWTAVNLGTSTWTDINGVMSVQVPAGTTSNIRLYHKSLPTPPFKLNTIIYPCPMVIQFTSAGFGFYNTTDTKSYLNHVQTDNNGQQCAVDRYNSNTSFQGLAIRMQHWGGPIWLQLEDDNTNWYFRHSYNGKQYQLQFSVARNTHVTANAVCMMINRTNNSYAADDHYQFLGYWEE